MNEETLSQKEEKILKFWRESQIFEKSLTQRKKAKLFRFFEGPPTANGAPGFHHIIARVYKDLMCRWKTMEGFYVERKAGWDTHGLPVELQIEKELGIKHKSEIEKFGIAEFNKKAKESVWRYKDEWEKFTERMGYWLDLKHPYITYDPHYMETLWWIIKHIWSKGLLEKDYKVVPWCPRCETPLSSHEVAQGYQTTKDPSIYVKLKISAKGKSIKEKVPEYLLVWTTTPWTLPGNVAVAVNSKVTYTKFKIGDAYYWSVNTPPFAKPGDIEVHEKRSGKALIGTEYEPVFKVKPDHKNAAHKGEMYKVVAGDFVATDEGTGFVHIAPAFGEEDMAAGKKEGLPVLMNVSGRGRFEFSEEDLKLEPFFERINGKFVKDADAVIFQELKDRGVLYAGDLTGTEHEYPFCWRCSTPLLYYANESWFVRMTKLKTAVIRNNEKVNWIPAHLKEGRFGEWLRELKDWAFSRERYWGTPLPVWICGKCHHQHVVGSISELSDMAFGKNAFFWMRHGDADHITKGYIGGWPEKKSMISHLTPKGKTQVASAARALAKHHIDVIISSDLVRTKETVAVLKKTLKRAEVHYDARLREYNTGIFNYGPVSKFRQFFKTPEEKFTKSPRGGETLVAARDRYVAAIHDADQKYEGKNILVVGHGDPLLALQGKLSNLSSDQTLKLPYPKLGGWGQLHYQRMPHGEEGELDLHRPYVDLFNLECPKCKARMQRVKDVVDVWYDSGAMPFAQWHWPFENLDKVDKSIQFPADYIAEAVDQTRGWFYTLLAISTLLDKGPAYLNVVSTGHVLDEKGEKMSKSKGNIVDPWAMFEKYGADSLRWYFFTVNPPGEPKKFSERDLAKTHQDLLILSNVLKFWETYAAPECKLQIAESRLSVLDKWILAKLSQLTGNVKAHMAKYEIVDAGRQVTQFFVEDLSRWYVRRSRSRFQRPKTAKELQAASDTLGFVLLELAKLMAAFTPFLSEIIWRGVGGRVRGRKGRPESVHLATLPKPGKIAGAASLMAQGDAIRKAAALALKARAQAGIKVRQPLGVLEILERRDSVRLHKEWLAVLEEEVNVKLVRFVKKLGAGDSWVKLEENEWHVALDAHITPQLKAEGTVREIIRNIQGGRAELGLHPKDRVMVWVAVSAELQTTVQKSLKMIAGLVGARSVTEGKTEKAHFHKTYELEGHEVEIAIRKIS